MTINKCNTCGKLSVKGRNLMFISRIYRDGSGTEDVKDDMQHLNDTLFTLTCLSISEQTYIASEFNSYIVKLRNN